MATIKDIAKTAGVSTATVSMVLNGKDCISKKTRERVLTAARELSYIPSNAAKTLKTNKSRCIALFIGDIANPFFPEITKGVEEAAKKRDYSVIIYDLFGKNRDLIGQIDRAVSRHVDGLFLTGGSEVSERERARLTELADQGIRVVTTNRAMEWGKFPVIRLDEEEQVEGLLSKLVAYGHRHIACLSGYPGYWVSEIRDRIFKRVLEQYGLYRPEYVISGGFDFEDGREATLRLLREHPEVTAVMCVNDTLAIGCQAAARQIGRRIPEELSIFGIDGIRCMRYFYPEISTIDTHRYQCGYDGCMRLIDLIECGKKTPPEELQRAITIQCTIRSDATIAPPPDLRIA